MEYKLPPLNFSEDVEKYEAFHETKEVAFPVCKHKDTKIKEGRLRCSCGCAWSAPIDKLIELQNLLSRQ